jgi:hypothetical protein
LGQGHGNLLYPGHFHYIPAQGYGKAGLPARQGIVIYFWYKAPHFNQALSRGGGNINEDQQGFMPKVNAAALRRIYNK